MKEYLLKQYEYIVSLKIKWRWSSDSERSKYDWAMKDESRILTLLNNLWK